MRDTRRVSLAYVAVDIAKSMEVSIYQPRLSPVAVCFVFTLGHSLCPVAETGAWIL